MCGEVAVDDVTSVVFSDAGGLLWVDYGTFMLWRVVAPAIGLLIIAQAIARFARE